MIEINLLPGARRKRGGKAAGLKLPDLKVLVTAVKDPWLIAIIRKKKGFREGTI